MNLDELLSGLNESIFDPPKATLCKDIWTGAEELKPAVKKEIMSTLTKWLEANKVDQKDVKGISFIGSSTTYQYSDTSDLDINVTTSLKDPKLNELYKELPNGNKLSGTKHPINYYLTNTTEGINDSKTLYDLQKDKWIRRPKKSDIKIPFAYVLDISKFFMDGVDLRVSEYERDKKEIETYKKQLKNNENELDVTELQAMISSKETELLGDLDAIYVAYHMIKSFRKEGFSGPVEDRPAFLIKIESDDPNYSVNNLVYKEIERYGYFDKLKKYVDLRQRIKEKNK
jgi:hypothetical protein